MSFGQIIKSVGAFGSFIGKNIVHILRKMGVINPPAHGIIWYDGIRNQLYLNGELLDEQEAKKYYQQRPNSRNN
jgi:hypothetical protein